MDDACQIYEQEIKKAKEKIGILKNELSEVKNKLKINRKNSELLHEFKKISIKISKATYELEHNQSILKIRNELINSNEKS